MKKQGVHLCQKKLKCLSSFIAATIIVTTMISIPASAEEKVNNNGVEATSEVDRSKVSEGEVIWGEDKEYSWPSKEDEEQDGKVTINGVSFKLEDCGEVTVVPTRYIIPCLGNVGFGGNSDVSGDLVLPSKVKVNGQYYNVTKIVDKSFFACTKLTSIVIPDSIKSMGESIFYLDRALEKVVLPKNLEEFDEMTFYACSGLKDISISSENKLLTCENNVLFNKDKTKLIRCCNQSIENYVIPDTIETISNYAFYDISNLKNVIIPEGVKKIGECAFSECRNINNITIPSSVTSIEPHAFEYCSNLLTVTFAENSKLQTISDCAFESCSNLVNLVLPKDLKKIDTCAFLYCEKLNNVFLPNGLKYIGYGAFEGCKTIESICVPEQVEEIGRHAFAECSSLKEINIPERFNERREEIFS